MVANSYIDLIKCKQPFLRCFRCFFENFYRGILVVFLIYFFVINNYPTLVFVRYKRKLSVFSVVYKYQARKTLRNCRSRHCLKNLSKTSLRTPFGITESGLESFRQSRARKSPTFWQTCAVTTGV